MKITSAIHWLFGPATFVSIKNTKNGIMMTRSMVSLFGKFIVVPPCRDSGGANISLKGMY